MAVVSFAWLLQAMGATELSAQEEEQKQGIWTRFHVRQNLKTKQDVAKPAFFTITDPEEEDRSEAVGFGVKYDAVDRTLLTLGPFLEYHRNTLIDEEQNVGRGGLAMEWWFRSPDPAIGGANNTGIVTANLDFKKDEVEDTEGGELSVMYTHLWVGQFKTPRPNHYFPIGDPFDPAVKFVYFPSLGLELEEISEAEDSAAQGTILRGVADLAIAFYPKPKVLKERLELVLEGAYRTDLTDDTNEEDDTHPWLGAELNYYFFKNDKRTAGVGLSYVDGANPSDGLEDQSYWELALKVQLD